VLQKLENIERNMNRDIDTPTHATVAESRLCEAACLRDLFSLVGIVVNSEDFPWLQTAGATQKPDLFVVPLWAYSTKTSNRQRHSHDETFRYGVLADHRLRDTCWILDANVSENGDGTAMGELVIYLQLISWARHVRARGMLFGPSKFWLVECQGNELISRL
jgi:hypothetical protein